MTSAVSLSSLRVKLAIALLVPIAGGLVAFELSRLWPDYALLAGALVTLAVVPNAAPDKYDGLAVDDEGRVTGRVLR